MKIFSLASLILVVSVGCGRAPSPTDSAAAVPPAARSTSVASVQAAALSDTGAEAGWGKPYPGSWTPTAVYEDSLFRIEYPASATIERQAPDARTGHPYPRLIIARLPDCKWHCQLTITVHRDSVRDRLAMLVAELSTPKSRDDDEMPEGPERLIDSLPFGPDRAIHVSDYCGDCGQYEFITTHAPWVATIEYSLDDREGYNPALIKKIDGAVRTFRWRR